MSSQTKRSVLAESIAEAERQAFALAQAGEAARREREIVDRLVGDQVTALKAEIDGRRRLGALSADYQSEYAAAREAGLEEAEAASAALATLMLGITRRAERFLRDVAVALDARAQRCIGGATALQQHIDYLTGQTPPPEVLGSSIEDAVLSAAEAIRPEENDAASAVPVPGK